MNDIRIENVSRRGFLKAGGAISAGLVLGVHVPASAQGAAAKAGTAFAPNAFVRIGTDNTVTAILKVFLKNIELTGFARIVFISGGGSAYGFPLFGGYSLSKVAIVREVENISLEFTNKINDFSIIALAPGAMETNMLAKVREAGAEIRTVVDIGDTAQFIKNFTEMPLLPARALSGKFIHVKDELNSPDFKDKWMLRRIE